eukprot:CAMPEP_0119038792 /NCGR_PEP_ID=MMETSP1177-20130426/7915_1 /TAXON_ID=2985 /ORGANISM="Ochromonas sp, Strain CCMP1899" /LENGTH=31 /DNA_ID= /DNA_START= /DNA_END= /DNA_ORIENTATION=
MIYDEHVVNCMYNEGIDDIPQPNNMLEEEAK